MQDDKGVGSKLWVIFNFYIKLKIKFSSLHILPVLSSLFNVTQMHLKPCSAQDKLFILLCLSSCILHHHLLLSPYVSYSLLSVPHSPFNNLCSFLPSYTLHFFPLLFHTPTVMPGPFPIRQVAFCNSGSKPSNSCVSTDYMMKETAGLGPSLADVWGKVVKPILK